jgi:hypothetical protein
VSLAWRTDLGAGIRVGDLAAHLQDLDTAVCIGERWGVELARASEWQVLMNRIAREGPRALAQAAEGLGFDERDLFELDEWLHTGRWFSGPRRRGRNPWDFIEALADTETPEVLGAPTVVSRAEYRNPVEIVLTGSGFLLLGTVYVARLVRDWSSTRRIGAAAAREAEASAEASARTAAASAREAEDRAEMLHWLVDEAKAGRMPVPPGDLLNSVTHTEAKALRRLASTDVTLQLPQGLDPSSHEREPPPGA